MSGQAGVSKNCEWFYISIQDQRSMSIATIVMPDGHTRGPKEYFEGKRKNYLSWIDKMEPILSSKLKQLLKIENTILLKYMPSILASNISNDSCCNHLFEITPDKSLNDIKLEISINKPLSTKSNKNLINQLKIILSQ